MFNLIKNLLIKRRLEKASGWFEKHFPAQERFEDIEDWLEELENRIIELETDSHPPKDLCEFDSWETIDNRIKKLEEKSGH